MAKQVIVLGAGVSGLSAAWRLSDNGFKVDLFESSSSVGGLAGTLREGHHCLDLGPHSFFSDNQQIVDTVLELFDHKLEPTQRKVKFYYKGHYIDYPLKAHALLFQMGVYSSMRTVGSFLKTRFFPPKRTIVEGEDQTVEDWAISSFGEHLYRTFFKPYTEQFWQIPCSELSSQAIPTHTRMSFTNTLRALLRRKVSKTGESLIEREMLPTYYPDTGFVEIAERITEVVEKNRGGLHLGCRVTGLNRQASGKTSIHYQENGQARVMEGDYIISTIPLPLLMEMLNPTAPPAVLTSARRLDYRPLLVLGMLTEKQDILSCSYTYMLNKPYNRIFEMNHFSPHTSSPGENIIGVEIPCLQNSAAWTQTKEELFDRCIGSLTEDDFLRRDEVKQLFLIKAPHAYPIYRKGYAAHLSRLMDYLKSRNGVVTLGRCGEFMYMDIDKCIERAFDLADKLIKED